MTVTHRGFTDSHLGDRCLIDVFGRVRVSDQQHCWYHYESLAFPRWHFEHTMLRIRADQLTQASNKLFAYRWRSVGCKRISSLVWTPVGKRCERHMIFKPLSPSELPIVSAYLAAP